MVDETILPEIEALNSDIKDHLRTLFNLVVELNAGVVVEVGTGLSTYALMAGANKTNGHLWSIDQFPTAQRDRYPQWAEKLETDPNYTFLGGNDMDIVKTWDKPIDFFFLDSSHQYQHTLDELKEWGKWVKVGGKIAMHDTHHTVGHAVGCRIALDEFLGKNPGFFSAEHNPDCGGFSILTKLREG